MNNLQELIKSTVGVMVTVKENGIGLTNSKMMFAFQLVIIILGIHFISSFS